MKQIAFLFFTFLGICTGFAQKPADKMDSISIKENPSIRLYPNPAKNKIEIDIKAFAAGYVQVLLMDKSGNIVRDEKRLMYNGNETITFMFSEMPGLYFLLLKQGQIKVKSKLIIQ